MRKSYRCIARLAPVVTVLFCLGLSLNAQTPQQDKETTSKQDTESPQWVVVGTVTDGDGNPMPGVTVRAHCGMGTLKRTGQATTDKDGRYTMPIALGFYFVNENAQTQISTISANREGYYERDFGRSGDLLIATKLPAEFTNWGNYTRDHIILPSKPRQVDFCLLPATRIAGQIVDESSQPCVGYSVSLRGEKTQPSSSSVGSAKTDEAGRFEITSVPPGFDYQLLVSPSNPHPPWNAWASGPLKLHRPAGQETDISFTQNEQTYSAKRFQIQLVSGGVNWKQALKLGAEHQSLKQTADDALNLTLHPPGTAQSEMHLPESIKIEVAERPRTETVNRFEATIDLTKKRNSFGLEDSDSWQLLKLNQIRSKLSGTFELDLYFQRASATRDGQSFLVTAEAMGDDDETISSFWQRIAGENLTDSRRCRFEFPRPRLSHAKSVRVLIRELADDEQQAYAVSPSKTQLRLSKGDDDQWTFRFQNPIDKYRGSPTVLDESEHQVIFQVFLKDAEGKTVKKVLRQLRAKAKGEYVETLEIPPAHVDSSLVSITFVTIQPNHDEWVDKFFNRGKGTSYKGLWLSDSATLRSVRRIETK